MDVFARFHPLVLVGYYVVAFSLLLTIGHPLLFALTAMLMLFVRYDRKSAYYKGGIVIWRSYGFDGSSLVISIFVFQPLYDGRENYGAFRQMYAGFFPAVFYYSADDTESEKRLSGDDRIAWQRLRSMVCAFRSGNGRWR